jgi:hypothetical protein
VVPLPKNSAQGRGFPQHPQASPWPETPSGSSLYIGDHSYDLLSFTVRTLVIAFMLQAITLEGNY